MPPSIVQTLTILLDYRAGVQLEVFGQELPLVEYLVIFLEAEQLDHHTAHGVVDGAVDGADLRTPTTLAQAPDGAHHTAAVATEAFQVRGQGQLQVLEAPVDDDCLKYSSLFLFCTTAAVVQFSVNLRCLLFI